MARIAHFIDTWDSGGAERVLVDLCTHLPRLGYETEIHHFGNVWIADQCKRRSLTCVLLSHESWYRSKWSVGAFALSFASHLRRRKIDLLHSHLVGPISAGAVAAKAAGIPHVGTLHDVFHINENPQRLLLVRMAAKLGTKLVTVSGDMQRFFREKTQDRIVFERIYNGIERSDFASDTTRAPEAFKFLSVGRLVALKGHDLLLRALAQPGLASLQLKILGDGPERASLESLAASLGVSSRVEFLGFRADVAEVLASAHAFVLASRSEGLSCSIMEAMAAGLPCVVTDVGGNRELVEDGGNGFLVPPDLPEALAMAMARLASDRDLARRMGERSWQRVDALFSMETTLRRYDDLYRDLIPQKRSSRTIAKE